MTFVITVWAETIFPEPALLKCAKEAHCTFTMKKDYTPVIHYISPKVTYYESHTQVIFNPKNTLTLIKDLEMDEMPFINAKIGGNLIDFEDSVDSATSFRAHWLNRARGQIGESTISKKQNITMMWETGKASVAEQESTFCNFDQSDCYQAKSIPVIFSTSEDKGYITGGQNITVKGYGFDTGVIDAKIDGQVCKVTAVSKYEFSCTVQAKAAASDLSKKYIGQHGISRKFVNKGKRLNFNTIKTESGQMQLALNMESDWNKGDNIGSHYKGWFVPPTTARYRFYMTCDDKCELDIAPCADTITPLTRLITHTYAEGYKDFFSKRNF